MASRASLNKVMLIGNLTRDPELRYTPTGAAVCTFGLATNRVFTASDGTKRDEAEFHRIVSWNKLAELCSQLLTKGRKVYVEGRLQTRNWQTPAGENRTTTEVVIEDMRILDSRQLPVEGLEIVEVAEKEAEAGQIPQVSPGPPIEESVAQEDKLASAKADKTGKSGVKVEKKQSKKADEDLLKDLPF